MKPQYKRVLLKLSGEVMLAHGDKSCINFNSAKAVAEEVGSIVELGTQVVIVIGGGNIFRGAPAAEAGFISHAQADMMGMLATVINGLALQEAFSKANMNSRLMSSVSMPSIAEPFTRQAAIAHLRDGEVVIVSGGTGRPFFSTDTAASLAAMETDCEVVMKATKVDGVYSDDPVRVPTAKLFETLTYMDVLQKKLKVMDSTAISMCMDHNIPVIVFNFFKHGNIRNAVMGQKVGTKVYG